MTYGWSIGVLSALTWRVLIINGLIFLSATTLLESNNFNQDEALLALVLPLPFSFALASLWIDLRYTDHHAAWRFKVPEKPVSLQLRLARNIMLIIYPQLLTLIVAGVSWWALDDKIRTETELAPFAIMASATLATFGWLYSNYTTNLKTRQVETMRFLGEVKADDRHRSYATILKQFIRDCSNGKTDKIGDFTFLPEQIDRLIHSSEIKECLNVKATFAEACRYLLSHHEHVALSVRVGMFDYDVLQRQKRSRILGYYNTLFFVIVRDSQAVLKRGGKRRQYRRGNDIWENFIWLTHKLGEKKSRINSDVVAKHVIDPRRTHPPGRPIDRPDQRPEPHRPVGADEI
jgi:hypothetical protein